MPVAEFQPQQGVHIETDPTKTDKAGSGDDASIIDGMAAQLRVSPTATEGVCVVMGAWCWLCSLLSWLCGDGAAADPADLGLHCIYHGWYGSSAERNTTSL